TFSTLSTLSPVSYIELHASSAFSFLDGASLPEALVERAAALEYPALALLDRDGVYGAPRFHLAAKKAGLKAIIGAELTRTADRWPMIDDRGSMRAHRASSLDHQSSPVHRPSTIDHQPSAIFRLPVLIESQAGYKNLCRLLTRMKLRAAKGEGALALDEIDGQVGGLIAIGGPPRSGGGAPGLVRREQPAPARSWCARTARARHSHT